MTSRLISALLFSSVLIGGCSGPTGGEAAPATPDSGVITDSGEAVTTFTVLPDDPGIRYVGRWNLSDPTAPELGWQGGSLALAFQGTDATLTLDAGNTNEYARVIVDGDQTTTSHVALLPGLNTVVLAENLESGPHTVEFVRETYWGTNFVPIEIQVTGSKLIEPPPKATRSIEFYGDSNLAGYALMSETNDSDARYVGSHFSLAGIAARALSADYTNISVSGETLRGMTQLYDRIDWYAGVGSWDFDRYTPDVIVVNLGANDIDTAGEMAIRQRYVTLLDLLRTAHPDVHIVIFNGWGWSHDEPSNYTAEVVAEYGDPNVSVATFPWVFEQWHGCEPDHAGMASYLLAHLEETLGWQAQPLDVMNGYGLNGDLANGSFEEVAPFGGFGWRYAAQPGVERITQSSDAKDGSALLRLSQGATVHQPNPARPGQTVTVTLWLRAEEAGQSVDVSIDFRDQTMWTDPLQTETTTLDLSTEWARYTVAAAAPELTDNPVFHTRLTIAAGPGSTVDIDALSSTTED